MEILLFIIIFIPIVWAVYNFPVIIVGLGKYLISKEENEYEYSNNLPKVSIIIPAKNEEKVIGRTLDAVLRLNYPSDKTEIIIVEDGSKDRTPEICEAYAKNYPEKIKFIRKKESNGKPAALNYALKFAEGDIVAIFDADTIPSRNALLKASKYFKEENIVAVQGKIFNINPNQNFLTKYVSYQIKFQYEIYMKGKDTMGLFVPLNGTCYFIKRNTLLQVGGWDENHLSEDTELAVRLTEKGFKIKYASDIVAWQETPSKVGVFFKQRVRWYRGTMEVGLKYYRILRKISLKAIDAEMTLAGPYVMIITFTCYLIGFSTIFFSYGEFTITLMFRIFFLVYTLAILVFGIFLALFSNLKETKDNFWIFYSFFYWFLQNFIAIYALAQIILRRKKIWYKTEKEGIITDFNIFKKSFHVLKTN